MSKEKKDRAKKFGRLLVIGGITSTISEIISTPAIRISELSRLIPSSYCSGNSSKWEDIRTVSRWIQPRNYFNLLVNWENLYYFVPLYTLKFSFYSLIRNHLVSHEKYPYERHSFIGFSSRFFFSGAVAGASAEILFQPFRYGLSKLHMDYFNDIKRYRGINHCIISKAMTKGGIKKIYKGFGYRISGTIPGMAAYFGIFDLGRHYINKFVPKENKKRKFVFKCSLAIFATTVSELIRRPVFDVQSRIRIEKMMSGAGGDPRLEHNVRKPNFKTFSGCLKYIVRNEGILSLYRGFSIRIPYYIAPALCLILYDIIGSFMELKFSYIGL